MLPFIQFFDFQISMFVIFQAIGALFGIFLMIFKRHKFGLDNTWDILQASAFALIGGAPGAVLINAIYVLIEEGVTNNVMPAIWQLNTWRYALSQGNAFFGLLIGASIAVFIFAKVRRLPVGKLAGVLTYLVASGTVLGRLGCYFNGCCYGITLLSGVQFPSQLAETGYAVLILSLFLTARFERKNPDMMFPLFVILYSAGRLVFEFFRADTVRVGLVSMSQWVALLLIIGCVVWLVKTLRKPTPSVCEEQKTMEQKESK